jgi:Na+-transporting methylmalonyl-CoA/oxaloacetate decarboxylase gamma subunit
MIDWGLVAEIAGGGFGVTILALVILCVAAWIMGWAVQKTKSKPAETPEKEK